MTNAMSLCPFCGSTSDSTGQQPFPMRDRPRAVWIARCGNPECGAEVIGGTADQAVRKWNRRAAEPPACTDCQGRPDANGIIEHKPACSIDYLREPRAKLTPDDICSCGKRMGEHPAQQPWWPCMVRAEARTGEPSGYWVACACGELDPEQHALCLSKNGARCRLPART